MIHDTAAAISFLQRWIPGGPWTITSIIPDGALSAATFPIEQVDAAIAWVEERQGKENIYFQVNPLLRPLFSKASKEDVARVAWLHVDIDPRLKEDYTTERARILGSIHAYSKKPTVVIDSGGGFQVFWRLHSSPCLETRGDVSRALELERYNIQLEMDFGADSCHNLDRIMRLPGTINVPNARKKKNGRLPTLAKLIEFNDLSYEFGQFSPAQKVQGKSNDGPLSNDRPKIAVSGNIPDIGVDELKEWASKNGKTISDHCYALIATGQDPADPDKYPSRSEALFCVCCNLIRAQVPDEMIFAVIVGQNAIASSVRENRNWEAYALRQITRAKDEVISPILRELNENYAVIADIGGKCRIVSETYDPVMKRSRLSYQSFEDFRNVYCNRLVDIGLSPTGKMQTKRAGNFWIDHPNRRQYKSIAFAPGQELDGIYNLWKGFAVESRSGNGHASFLTHIRENICSGNSDNFDYLIQWMAYAVQKPDAPGEVSVVLRGNRGTGKGVFAKEFGSLWGRHFLQVSNSKHLIGNFNVHLQDVVVVFGDEAFYAGDRQHEGGLKTLITEETLVVERKGVDSIVAPNFVHLILASNDGWVVPAGLDERRFFVLDVGDSRKQDHSYFAGIRKDLDNGGRESLLHLLLTMDLKNFNVRRVPQTGALMEQKILSMDAETEWLYSLISEGISLHKDTQWRSYVSCTLLYDDYIRRMDQQRRQYRLNPTAFGRFLGRCMPRGWPKRTRELVDMPQINDHGVEFMSRERVYVYHLPALAAVRKHWDLSMGGPFDWPEVALIEEEKKPKNPF
jgi:hypothetical protein